MAIRIDINYPGGRGVHRGNYNITAAEVRHVKLSGDTVGLNISPERGKASSSIRMTIEEARMLAEMLLQGAEIAERRMTRESIS